MSPVNIEILKRIYERWSRDREIEPELFHPDFEIRTPIMELENRRHLGYQGYTAWRTGNDEVLADNWFEAAEFMDHGDRVVVTGWLRLTGKASGIETRQPAVHLWTFKEGKPASMLAVRTVEEALADGRPE